jgi:hypothetical protein
MPRRLLGIGTVVAATVVAGLLQVTGSGVTGLSALQPALRSAFDVGTMSAQPLAVDLHVEVAHSATPATVEETLDLCQGPVAVRFEGIRPTLLAEHDFCGGTWVLGLDPGQVVDLRGSDDSGTYLVTRRIKVVPKGSPASTLQGMGDVVAQTCRPDGSTLRLVGLSRIE